MLSVVSFVKRVGAKESPRVSTLVLCCGFPDADGWRREEDLLNSGATVSVASAPRAATITDLMESYKTMETMEEGRVE